MKKCMKCGRHNVKNPDYDYCYECFTELEDDEEDSEPEDNFENHLDKGEVFTTYIMFYDNGNKIGHTKDLNSRMLEIKREFPNNQLVYFREFCKESESRRFEAWLKTITERELNKIISAFQDKIIKIKRI